MLQRIIKFLKTPFSFVRYTIIPSVKNLFALLKRFKSNSIPQNNFITKLNHYKIKWNPNNKNVVLTQSVSDYAMGIKLAAASHYLASQKKANIAVYTTEYDYYNRNWLSNFISSSKFKTRLDKIYLSFAGKALYRNTDLYHDQNKINQCFSEIKKQITSKQSVINICIEEIKMGDLIGDTYLRYANQPEINIKDPFLDILIIQALNIYFVTKQKLEAFNVLALVSSYTSYIYHGISVRLCLQKNIPVYTIGAYYSLVHKSNIEFPGHANSHFLFNKLFQRLNNKEDLIKEYKTIFEKRFQGEVDAATTYMKESAFSSNTNTELNTIDWNNTVVVLAHCFFDSPHIYRDLLFPDFYDWMTFTLDELIKQKQLTVLVKEHPNGLPANQEVFTELKIKYKNTNIKFIDKKTSQLQIMNARPKAIITAYGNAAAEFSYHGIPVLTVYDNPFTAYNFTHLANSINEYKNLLENISTLLPIKNQNQIVEYYYMQFFFFLMGRNVDYLKFAKYKGQTASDEFLNDYVPGMDNNYFTQLDAAIKNGFELIEWETKNI